MSERIVVSIQDSFCSEQVVEDDRVYIKKENQISK